VEAPPAALPLSLSFPPFPRLFFFAPAAAVERMGEDVAGFVEDEEEAAAAAS
jgi:hypothetical protein